MRKKKKEIFYFFVNISLDPLLILRVTIQKVLWKSFFRACRIFFTFIWKPWINFRGSRLWCDTFMRRLHSCFIFGGRYFVLVWFFFGEYNNRICFLHASACNDTLHFCKDLDLQKNLYRRFYSPSTCYCYKNHTIGAPWCLGWCQEIQLWILGPRSSEETPLRVVKSLDSAGWVLGDSARGCTGDVVVFWGALLRVLCGQSSFPDMNPWLSFVGDLLLRLFRRSISNTIIDYHCIFLGVGCISNLYG